MDDEEMQISFTDKKLEKILTNVRLMKKYYASIFEKLRNRLSELSSVNNLSLISHQPPPRRHKLSGEYSGLWAVDVSKKQRLVFKALNGNDILEDITEIMIIGIIDYH